MGFGKVVFSLRSLLSDLGEVLVLATLGLGPWDLFPMTQVWQLPQICPARASVLPFRAEIVLVMGKLEKLGQWQGDGQGDPGGEGNWVGCLVCALLLPLLTL